jgi:hypothetical protein
MWIKGEVGPGLPWFQSFIMYMVFLDIRIGVETNWLVLDVNSQLTCLDNFRGWIVALEAALAEPSLEGRGVKASSLFDPKWFHTRRFDWQFPGCLLGLS